MLAGWQNLELHEMVPAPREQYYVTVSSAFARQFEWNGCLNVPSPTMHSYYSGLAVQTENGDMTAKAKFIKWIAELEFVVSGVMAFLRSCHEGFLYNKVK